MKRDKSNIKLTEGELKSRMLAEKRERERRFGDKLALLKKEFNCDLRPTFVIKVDGIIPGLEIVAL